MTTTSTAGSGRAAPAPAEPDPHGTAERRFALTLLAVAVVALGVRLAFLAFGAPPVPRLGDARAYHLLANNLADGRGYIRPFDLLVVGRVHATAEYPPLFPGLLAAASFLGGRSVDAQRVVMCFLGTGTVVLIGLLGRRVAGAAVGLVAATLAAFYPMLVQPDAALMTETLFAFLVVAMLLLTYRVLDRPSMGRFAALGLVVGLATLTRPEGGLLGIALLVPAAVRCRGGGDARRRAMLGVAGVGLAVVTVLPWTLRNYARFDTFVPVSNNSFVLEGANCDLTYHGPQIGLWRSTFTLGSRPSADPQCFPGFEIDVDDFNEARVAAEHRARGLDYAREHAGRLPVVMGVRWLRTWGLFRPHQQVQVASLEGRSQAWETAGTWMYWSMLPLAGAGFVVGRRRGRRLWPLLVPLATVSLNTVLTYGNQRFRVAAEPTILLLAALALVVFADRLRRGPPVGVVTTPDGGPAGGPAVAAAPAPPAEPLPRVHFPAFDGLRAIAAFSVIVVHVAAASGFNLRNRLGAFTARADIGVAVFFVISGFLLYRPFVDAAFAQRPALETRRYLWRRFLRIYPAYWVCLTLVLLFFPHPPIGDAPGYVLHYALLHIYRPQDVLGPIQQSWTLATEVSFYVFLPLYAWVLRRVGGPGRLQLRAELAGLAVLYAVAVGFRVGLLATRAAHNGTFNTWLIARLDLFALGMLLAVASTWSYRHRTDLAAWLGRWWGPPLSWALAGLCYWVLSTQIGLTRFTTDFTGFQQTALNALWGLFGFLLVLPAVFGPQDRNWVRRFLRFRVVAWLGVVSYAIYLWHHAWLDWFVDWRDLPPFHGRFPTMFAFVVLVTVPTAAASWYLIEKPALRLKGRTVRFRRPVPAGGREPGGGPPP